MIMFDLPAEVLADLTPDARLLLEVINGSDEHARAVLFDGDASMESLYRGAVDGSLQTVATLRAYNIMESVAPKTFMHNPVDHLAALWADGVLTGIEFARRGGHTEPEP
jgi:hypothetical protein